MSRFNYAFISYNLPSVRPSVIAIGAKTAEPIGEGGKGEGGKNFLFKFTPLDKCALATYVVTNEPLLVSDQKVTHDHQRARKRKISWKSK